MTRDTRSFVIEACILVGGLHFALWCWVAFTRFHYPFDVEWMEGGQLGHALRLLAGQPIYARPSADFTAFFYTPLYPALLALLGKLGLGVSHLTGRGLSVCASVATLSLLFWVVRREVGLRYALLGVGLYASFDRFTGTFSSVARADALALALAFGAVVLARYGASRTSAALAGGLAVLAVFAKQTMVLVGAGTLLSLLLWDRPRARVYAATTLLGGGLGAWLLEQRSGGWFSFYVLSGHQHHAFFWQNFFFYFYRDALVLAPLSLLLPVAFTWVDLSRGPLVVLALLHVLGCWVVLALTLDYPAHMYFRELAYESPRVLLLVPPALTALALLRFRHASPSWLRALGAPAAPAIGYFGVHLLAAVLASAVGHSTQWAYKNAFLPFALFSALFASLGAASLARRGRAAERALGFAVLVGLVAAFDAPSSRVPSAADHERALAIRLRLARIPGRVLVLAHPHSAHQHDGSIHLHQMGLSDVASMGGVSSFDERVRAHFYAAVVTDEGDGLDVPAVIRENYVPTEALDGPTMKTGVRVRPAWLWLPRR